MNRPISHSKTRAGFTLIEVVAASFVLLIAVTLALSGYIYSLKNSNQLDTQTELDMQVQLALEYLKEDLRLSSMDHIYYHPEGAPPYSAVSFPKSYADPSTGMMPRDADKQIIWEETIIYHIQEGTPDKLVRTVIPRESVEDWQSQLNAVVDGRGPDNKESKVIFENLLHWELNPRQGTYNGYAENLQVDRNVFLGFALIDSGDHTFTFEVSEAGDGNGYKIGVDTLRVTPSYLSREAENLTAQDEKGASASAVESSTINCSGGYYINFPAGAPGDQFTVTVDNDRWEESNFSQGSRDGTVTDRYMTTPTDISLRLDGYEEAWEASTQTASDVPQDPDVNMNGQVVRILIKGDSLPAQGGMIVSEGAQCRLKLRASRSEDFSIKDIWFGKSDFSEALSLAFDGNQVPVSILGSGETTIPAGGYALTDWIPISIDRTNNYVLSYVIDSNTNQDAPMLWEDLNVTDASINWSPTTKIATFVGGSSITPSALASQTADWLTVTGSIDVVTSSYLPALESVTVSYVNEGTYTSRIIDTTIDSPEYKDITWNADIPSGTDLSFKLRTADYSDMSDAAAWTNITSFSSPMAIRASYKRYIQFQATLKSSSDNLSTPLLKDVTIDWPGKTRLVNIGGDFIQGPDYGIFEISVDGRKLESALIVDLEIFKDQLTLENETRRISSSAKVEINPRNTPKQY